VEAAGGSAGLRRGDLSFGRLLKVWAPLAATFMLVTGSTPVVNASINRLPGHDHAADLAAFAVFLACTIVIHSPLFVTREIAIKLSVDRAGSRRAMRFCLLAGAVVAAFELLLGTTPLGAWVLGAFSDRPSVVAGAHRAFLVVWPVPLLIAVRGVYQAHQIRVDDTLFVGLGTLVRLGFTAVFGLVLAPHLGVSGPILGGLCITLGIATESIFAVVRARAKARPPERSEDEVPHPLRFGLPLMIANLLGVAAAIFYLRIAGLVPAAGQEASLAAFQEVKSLHWLLAAGALALQSLTTAKVRSPADVGAMLRFAVFACGVPSLLFALCAFTPLREWVLVDLMNEVAGGEVVQLAVPALMLAVAMPLLNGVRFTLRGVLISRGLTRAITVANITTILILVAVILFGLRPFGRNGALNAYVFWVATLLIEIAILARLASGSRRWTALGGRPAGTGRWRLKAEG
jgi:Na+-driven multidrug efflux pump